MRSQQETETLTRRELFETVFDRAKALSILVPLVAACASSTPGSDQRVSTGVAGATDSQKGKPEATKPAELAGQAKDLVLDKWLSFLNSPQKKAEYGYETFLDINVKNMEAWRKNIPSVFTNQGSPTDAVMNISWVSGQTFFVPGRGWNALKFTGEMEAKEVRVVLTDQRGTGKPDDNGFQWSGEFRLDLRARSHVNNYSFDDFNTNQEALMIWLAGPNDRPFPNFSPFESESLNAKLVLQKGTWNWDKDPFKRDPSTANRGLLDNLSLPSRALYQGGASGCRSYDSCSQIRMPAFK